VSWSRLASAANGLRDHLKSALVRHAHGDLGAEARIANAIDSTALIAEKKIREWVGRSSSLEKRFVEAKYDRLAGSYNQSAFFGSEKIGMHVVGGEIVRCPYTDFFEAKMDAYAGFLRGLDGVETALEVGAGELTTTGALAMRLPEVAWHGVELSFNRVLQGKRFFQEHFGIDIAACKGDAMRLPYADRSFDLVVTSHCLEHIPFGYEKALDEIMRVAKRHVVLFEPVWEIAERSQKLRMYAQGYVRGLLPYLESQSDFVLTPPVVLDVGTPFNRTTRLHLERQASGADGSTELICPACRGKLAVTGEGRTCSSCRLLFPITEGVPVMDPQNAQSIGRAP
jgi:SAM-dependent methyltransferase